MQASSGNLVERNVSFNNDAGLPARAFTDACGILLFEGAAENVIRRNEVFGNAFGILIGRAGPGNVIDRNDSHDNRSHGIRNNITNGTLIDRNEVVHNRVTNLGPGKGIDVEGGSTKVVVTRNEAFDNTPDLFWDQLGSAEFSRNTCANSQPPGLCQGGRLACREVSHVAAASNERPGGHRQDPAPGVVAPDPDAARGHRLARRADEPV